MLSQLIRSLCFIFEPPATVFVLLQLQYAGQGFGSRTQGAIEISHTVQYTILHNIGYQPFLSCYCYEILRTMTDDT